MHTIKLHSLVDKLTLLILCSLYLNFLSVCLFTISCSSYIPTLSYLATFRTHDTVVVMSLSIFAFGLVPVFLTWHIKVHKLLSLDEFIFMLFLEMGIVVLTITVSLIDETNGIEFNPVDNLHHFLSFSLSFIVIIWIYYSLHFLENSGLSGDQRVTLYTCWVIYKIGFALYILTLYQWHFAYTIYNNSFTNPVAEAICEWMLITLAIRFPVYFTRTISPTLTISTQDKSNE